MVEFAAMDWLKDHSYLATWISASIAITMAGAKAIGKLASIDWRELISIILLLTCVGVAMSPVFDEKARSFAQTLIFFLLGYGVLDMLKRRQ